MTKKTKEMPFWEHMEELRVRFLRCLYVFLATSCIAYFFHEPITHFLKLPLLNALPEGEQSLVFTEVFEVFLNSIQVSIIAGFILALPYIFHQVWAFVSPGLQEKEKKMSIPFVVAGTIFFLMGAAFAYYFIFPYGFKLMIDFGQQQNIAMITVKDYFRLVFRLLLLFGLSFELPVALVFMSTVGILNAESLKRNRRIAIISVATISALCAPPDVLSMLIMMAPLYLLYELTILLVLFLEKKRT